MTLSPLVAIVAGTTSAVLFLAAVAAGPAGLFFSLFLSPLPVAIAGLGWSWRTAIGAAAVAALGLALVVPIQASLLHVAAIGLPAAAASYFLLLNRDVSGPDGQPATEWFPVGWVFAGIAVWSGLISGAALLLTGSDIEAIRAELAKAVDTFLEMRSQLPAQLPEQLTEDQRAQLIDLMVNLLPGVIASVWLLIATFALWLGGRVTRASGQLNRPWPDLTAIVLPRTFPLWFIAAIAGSAVGGMPGLIASGFSWAFFVVYLFLGLAIIHQLTRGQSFRIVALLAVYVGLLILPLTTLLIAMLALAEPILPFRRSTLEIGGPPPSSPNSPPGGQRPPRSPGGPST